MWTDEPLPDLVAGLLDGKPTEHGIADALWSYWSVAVAPYWPPIHAVIEDDVSYRGSQILSGGLYDLLSDLHPEVSLRGSRLLIDKPHHKHGVYSDGELTLVPSVFVWPNLTVGHDTPGHFELHYAARGVGNVWSAEEAEMSGDTLARAARPNPSDHPDPARRSFDHHSVGAGARPESRNDQRPPLGVAAQRNGEHSAFRPHGAVSAYRARFLGGRRGFSSGRSRLTVGLLLEAEVMITYVCRQVFDRVAQSGPRHGGGVAVKIAA